MPITPFLYLVGGSMILELRKTNDSLNVINKSSTLITTVYDVVLRSDFNLANPTFKLVLVNDVLSINHVKLIGLDRDYYYYVSSVESNGSVVEIRCVCDVLETFKAEILNSEFSYYRSVKAGDELDVSQNNESVKLQSTIVDGSVEIELENSLILTTVGG